MELLAAGAKLYYRIGDVARMTGLKPSVIRFWETEFPAISPQKSKTGQRLYSQLNISEIIKIKELLYQEKLTIAGAKKRLRQPGSPIELTSTQPTKLQQVIDEISSIREMLRD